MDHRLAASRRRACDTSAMALTRRAFLTASAGLLAGGCVGRLGAGTGPQTLEPAPSPSANQLLDPDLVLSLPRGAVSPATISTFARTTGVRVRVDRQGSQERLLLNPAPG